MSSLRSLVLEQLSRVDGSKKLALPCLALPLELRAIRIDRTVSWLSSIADNWADGLEGVRDSTMSARPLLPAVPGC